MKKLIIALLFLCSCSHENEEHIALREIYSAKRMKDVAKEFLTDIGGEEVVLSSGVRGFYFNAKTFQKKEIEAYKKWRLLFAKPKNCHLTEMFQMDFQGQSLLALFSLPKTHMVRKENVMALCLPSFSLPFEFDPKWILTYLSKGVHIFAINYEKGEKTTSADWESACESALSAALWLEAKSPSKLIILGKSLGAVPASYVAANRGKASLILENPIIIQPLKTKEWLKQVEGKIVAIQSVDAKISVHLPSSATLFTVLGSHFGRYFGDTYPTWYENENDQIKLLHFLME